VRETLKGVLTDLQEICDKAAVHIGTLKLREPDDRLLDTMRVLASIDTNAR
jgi:hypothetical protein